MLITPLLQLFQLEVFCRDVYAGTVVLVTQMDAAWRS
jgi:hypothetical protein